jgi:hypothetical protein
MIVAAAAPGYDLAKRPAKAGRLAALTNAKRCGSSPIVLA